MKALIICPSDKPAVPHLSALGPLATTPILGGCAVVYWIEHLAALGARQVEVIAPGGEEQVRAAVGDGARWGIRITVTACKAEPTVEEATRRYRPANDTGWIPSPCDVVPVSHLPGCPGLTLFESYAGWFAALLAWMPLALTPGRVRMTELRPRVWVGSRARISPKAELIAPCWIGDQASVEDGAVVGPGAILEDRAVVDEMARVTQSWVGPDTCVGPMTAVSDSLAWGSTLTNWRTDSSLHVPDPFLLCSLAKPGSPDGSDRFGRVLGAKAPAAPNLRLITAIDAPLIRASHP